MIKANELRIGNLIYHPKTDKNITVEYHHIRFAVLYPDNEYEPIHITPEILIAAGFEKSEYKKREQWLGPTLIRYQRTTEYKLGIIKSESYDFYTYEDSVCLVRIDYLHQLQNLYFALTGKELEIKLLIPTAP